MRSVPSFSEQLRQEAQPIWQAIFEHPFLRAIKDGSLPPEAFRYYLAQDYLYLEGFARTVALALAKAPDSQTLEELSHRVLTPIERPLHHRLLAEAGVTMDDIQRTGLSPTNTAYINHMLKTAYLHGLGPTAAALLPWLLASSYGIDFLQGGQLDVSFLKPLCPGGKFFAHGSISREKPKAHRTSHYLRVWLEAQDGTTAAFGQAKVTVPSPLT